MDRTDLVWFGLIVVMLTTAICSAYLAGSSRMIRLPVEDWTCTQYAQTTCVEYRRNPRKEN